MKTTLQGDSRMPRSGLALGNHPGYVTTGQYNQNMHAARTVAKMPKEQQDEYWRKRDFRRALASDKVRHKAPITLAQVKAGS